MIRAEWTKLRSTPETRWLLVMTVLSTVGLAALAVASCHPPRCGIEQTLTGVRLGQAVVAIVAVLVISDEYRTGLMRVTLAAAPRRWWVLAAKSIVVTGVLLPVATVAVAGSLLTSRPALDGEGLRAAGGSVLYLVLIGLLSLGIGALLRSPAAAIGAVLAVIYVLPILAAAAPDPEWARRLHQLGPMDAGLAIQATGDLSTLPIQPWHGLGVLALWAAAALLAGGTALASRDA